MSDLSCAATIVMARHAEAEYDTDLWSDAGGSLTLEGRAQAQALGEALGDRNVAAIWCSDMSLAVQTAEIAAAVLGVAVRVRPGLHEFGVGDYAGEPFSPDMVHPVYEAWLGGDLTASCPAAENGVDVVRRMAAEIEAIADQYRGETVLVVSHGGAIGVSLAQLSTNVAGDFPRGRQLLNCDTCELAVDSDGIVLRTWAGQPVESP
ncbi:MAG: histidine phosphatase family protein [Nocardioidaceae bacterium]